MSSHRPISKIHASLILAELAELSLALARDLHARTLAAKTPEAAAKLAEAFDLVSRECRSGDLGDLRPPSRLLH